MLKLSDKINFKKLVFTFFVSLFVLSLLVPILSFAQQKGLVPCEGPLDCDLCALLKLVENIVNYLFIIAFPIGAAMVAWAGIKIMTAAGSEQKVKEGRDVLWIAIIGIALTLGSWLILSTFVQFVSGGGLNPFGSVTCTTSQIARPPTPTRPPGEQPPVTTDKHPSVGKSTQSSDFPDSYYNEDAIAEELAKRMKLEDAGVTIRSTDGTGGYCTSYGDRGCTDVRGLPDSTINSIIALKKGCDAQYGNCRVAINGGSEAGHQEHRPGVPIYDLDNDNTTDKYLTGGGPVTVGATYNKVGDGCGYWREDAGHWHVRC